MALIVTSGGLGPTADDLTAEVVGRFSGREMVLDPRLEERIGEILEPMHAALAGLDPDAIRASNRKQAVIPEGATVLDPVGTAPGLVVPPARRHRARPSSSSRGRRASSSRCGRWRRRPTRSGPRSRAPRTTAARSCGCSGSPSRRSRTRCARPRRRGSRSTGSRSPPACAAGEIEIATRYEPPAPNRLTTR